MSASQAERAAGRVVEQQSGLLDRVTDETQKRRASVIEGAANVLGVAPSKVCGLLRNVWTTSNGKADLTDAEMFSGLSLISRYNLDPIAREVYVTRGKGDRLITIVGIDGWIKILDRTEGYDGFEQEFGFDKSGKVMEWVETKIYTTKRSRPTTYRAFASEYTKVAGVVAGSMPSHMLRLFSLRHAARLYTPIGGNVMTEEEARYLEHHEVLPGDSTSQPKSVQDLKARFERREPEPEAREPEEVRKDPEGPPDVASLVEVFLERISRRTTPQVVEQDVASAKREITSLPDASSEEIEQAIKQVQAAAKSRIGSLSKASGQLFEG